MQDVTEEKGLHWKLQNILVESPQISVDLINAVHLSACKLAEELQYPSCFTGVQTESDSHMCSQTCLPYSSLEREHTESVTETV